jgi:hypothetical protein
MRILVACLLLSVSVNACCASSSASRFDYHAKEHNPNSRGQQVSPLDQRRGKSFDHVLPKDAKNTEPVFHAPDRKFPWMP